MNRKLCSFGVAVCLLFAPMVANAVATAWEIQGHLTEATGNWPPDFAVGTPFRIVVTYDPIVDNTLLATEPGTIAGSLYRYRAPSLTYAIFIGTTCAPCEPANDPAFDPDGSRIILRDGYDTGAGPVDGITFALLTPGGVTMNLLLRGGLSDMIDGAVIPATPDARVVTLDRSDPRTVLKLQVCNAAGDACAQGFLDGAIESVSLPTYGTNWFLSARDCYYIDTTTTAADAAPNDCIFVNAFGQARLGRGRAADNGGGAGHGEFARTFTPTSDFDAAVASYGQSLGSVFGAVTFGGPASLPVVKARSLPSAISRANGNAQAYQQYRYNGTTSTQLPLVVDLTYGIADYSDPTDATAGSETGLRPGGATISAVLAIVDGDRVSLPAVAASNFGSLECGAEPGLVQPDGTPWPAGSILGTAAFASPDGQRNASAATQLTVTSCTQPGQAVQLTPGQSFIVATSMQTPARGQWTASTKVPTGSGYVDAANTLRVTFDPNAPAALVEKLADSIAPACTDCDFVPETLHVAVDVKPDSTSCINAKSNGVIPVAILGSSTFKVSDVRLDETLTLGASGVRVRAGKPKCSITQVNGDAYPDLLCNFENSAVSWQPGQTSVTLAGKLHNGLPITGSDNVCVK